MGQKVNPLGIRLGITRDWTRRWYAGKKQFPLHVHTDFRVREFLKKQAEGGLGQPHAHRARRQEGEHHHPDRASGHRHRQEGRGHREAAPGDGRAARHAGHRRAPEHRRDQKARARLAAGRRFHRAADREARDVPPRHEARGHEHHAKRRAGREGARLRPPERRRNRAHRVVPRGPHPAAHLPRRHRLRPVRGADHLRRHRRQGVDLQGRSVRQGASSSSRRDRGCRPPRLPPCPRRRCRPPRPRPPDAPAQA